MVTNEPPEMDLVFRALAHSARRRILDILMARPGSRVGDVAEQFGMSRIAVMKHLAVLSEAALVVSERTGRERRLYVNPVPIRRVHDRWTTQLGALAAGAALDLKRRVEAQETAHVAGS